MGAIQIDTSCGRIALNLLKNTTAIVNVVKGIAIVYQWCKEQSKVHYTVNMGEKIMSTPCEILKLPTAGLGQH